MNGLRSNSENGKNTIRKPVVFLDRDGVLTREKSYVCRAKDLEIFTYVAECIAKIKEKGYLTIVITNQSGIARGLFAEEELIKMNQLLMKKTGVDAIYYCPHYEQGIITKYVRKCSCRKPQTGMIEQACQDFDIDLTKSYMVGDRASDILTGQRAGIKTILLESGYGSARLEEQVTPDHTLNDLRTVADLLAGKEIETDGNTV